MAAEFGHSTTTGEVIAGIRLAAAGRLWELSEQLVGESFAT